MPIRPVLAEGNALLQGRTRLIDGTDGLELVGTARDLPARLELVEQHRPASSPT